MGWQSPQPGHQSAGSLRKHLRELGRQLKGADWRYRKVTQSMGALPSGCGPADSPGTQWVPAQASEASPATRATGQSLGSASHCCSCSPSSLPDCTPRTPTPAEPFTLEPPGTKSPLPQVITLRRGQKRKPCLRKSHHYPAVTQHTQPTEQGKANTAALLTHGTRFLCQEPPAKQPPICRRGEGKPQPRTSCQICLASPPTCNFHWLLIVQAVAAASF